MKATKTYLKGKSIFIISLISLGLFSYKVDGGILRGHEEESNDSKTYLVVEVGSCEEYFLDEAIWPYKVGQKGEISPGKHCLSCGKNETPVFSGTCFEVKTNTTFYFDYWGP